jgi:short-subunit dehydrogenase
MRAQMETNFFAPIKITQLLLPSMRARKSGTIVNISSVGGISALPSNGIYASSKFALEGMLFFLSILSSQILTVDSFHGVAVCRSRPVQHHLLDR